jgi:hypothetical protein
MHRTEYGVLFDECEIQRQWDILGRSKPGRARDFQRQGHEVRRLFLNNPRSLVTKPIGDSFSPEFQNSRDRQQWANIARDGPKVAGNCIALRIVVQISHAIVLEMQTTQLNANPLDGLS